MRLIWHMMKKDALRHRAWLTAWIAVAVVKIGLGFVAASIAADHGAARKAVDALLGSYAVLVFVQCGLAYIIALLWVQEDPVVGGQPFWRTRPVSRQRLLAAKMLGLAVWLGVLPVAFALPWWWHCGFTLANMADAARDLVLVQAMVAMPALFVGACANTLARALLWTLVPAALALALALPVVATNGSSYLLSLLHIGVGVTITLALAVVVQFQTRRLIASLAVALLGAAASLAVGSLWRVVVTEQSMPERFPERASGTRIEFKGAEGMVVPIMGGKENVGWLKLAFAANGIPPDTSLGVLSARHHWEWSDDTVFSSRNTYSDSLPGFVETDPVRVVLGLRESVVDTETQRWQEERLAELRERIAERHARRGTAAPIPRPRSPFMELHASVAASHIARMRQEPPRYRGELSLRLSRPVVVHELPLEASSWLRHEGGAMRLFGLTERKIQDSIATERVERMWLMWLEVRPAHAYLGHRTKQLARRSWRFERDGSGMLVNRSLGHVLLVREDPIVGRMNGVLFVWRQSSIRPPTVRRNGSAVPWPGWLDQTTFAYLTFDDYAVFRRTVEAERFELASASN